ncbi:MAG: transglutaminase family protein, partial [Ideonella sp.]|nr:transglutaminase family protein [Ideonella sp.]
EPQAERYPFAYDPSLAHELAPYLLKEPATPRLQALIDESRALVAGRSGDERMRSVDFLVALNQRLQRDIRYLIRLEPGVQTPEQTLENGSGSCRDSGWLLVQLCRHLGLAARFVSGYLIQLKPDVKALDGPSGTEVDFTDLHAWCEVYLPGAGWIGFDPTSGLLAGEGHIPLACSPDPSSAAPVTGLIEKAEATLDHHMRVTRVWEAPRVTKPYSDEQWAAIEALGHRVDVDLRLHDVRLTQGGEPTFVSVDDRDGAEWNTDALGPTKRVYGAQLLDHLRRKYGDGGLLHYGQGKWYPGEQLPRWSLNLFWRRDGQPVWSHPELFADESKPGTTTAAQAQAFLRGVAQRLALDPGYVFAGHEDTWYYLWRERRLPTNVDPFDSRLADELERERLRRVFMQGLDTVVGHALPVMRDPTGRARWQTGPWFLRDERCYLVPGDSPMGYRLPLDSQPWASAGDMPWTHAPDPWQASPPLPPYRRLKFAPMVPGGGLAPAASAGEGDADASAARTGSPAGLGAGTGAATAAGRRPPPEQRPVVDPARPPGRFVSAGWITRTAMVAEPRDGRLYVFMPPVSALEDYLELVEAVEDTAVEMNLPVILEGYEPPRDPRLAILRVTPDPGVIEVNIHPASGWEELVDQTTHLYDAAHQCRLSTEKFMLDGRHTGTGGGNHFVLGGATPSDSPFLRRPDLLASMVGYWHNHPSLSYLFSGLFIGPTSQAPRIDEARNDSVYEMEIAFAELQRQAAMGPTSCPPWLIDRLMRNLLIDVTGNTHRAEFCIDKMYSPDGPTGRLGLLEMRAFEMPPHARMSLSQQLLMRALVARFWQHPYRPSRLKRWGTELHDRFMLPHFVWQDLCDVVEELQDFGYAFKAEWFAPHFEFRFPKLGDFAV